MYLNMQLKICLVCKKEKPTNDFYMQTNKYKDKVYTYTRYLCKTCLINDTANWRVKNRDKYLKRLRNKRHTSKIKLIGEMGGKCICCGENKYWNLTFDHIIPLRRKDNKRHTRVDSDLIKNKKNRKFFQILCYGCNISKNSNEKCLLDHELKI